jgi:hypothetical protein
MATKFFWAFGYNQVESFLTTFDPKRIEIHPEATYRRPNGQRTPITRSDIDELLEHVARRPDGAYRVVAGRLIPGRIIGNFRYRGTRPDDPNDLVPHEHRRELRGLLVFGAWTNMTDFKAKNTMDTVLTGDGHAVVKHYHIRIRVEFLVDGPIQPRAVDRKIRRRSLRASNVADPHAERGLPRNAR